MEMSHKGMEVAAEEMGISRCSLLYLSHKSRSRSSPSRELSLGKGNKVSSVPLNSSARDAIAVAVGPRLGVEKPSIKSVAAVWPKSAPLAFEPLWESQKREALTTSAMGQMVADLVKVASELVPETTSAHTLRHTFARNYLAQYPGDLVGPATLLGYSSLDTTRLYSQPSVDQLATRVEQLNINAYAG